MQISEVIETIEPHVARCRMEDGTTRLVVKRPDQTWQDVIDAEPGAPTLREAKLEDLAARRWRAETGGTLFSGERVPTDRDARVNVLGAAMEAIVNPGYSVAWKMPSGFVTLDAPAVTALAAAVRGHVQACFERHAALQAALLAAPDDAAVAAIDIETGWPGQD